MEGLDFFSNGPATHVFLLIPILPTSYCSSDCAPLLNSGCEGNVVDRTTPYWDQFPSPFPMVAATYGSRTVRDLQLKHAYMHTPIKKKKAIVVC